MDSFEQSNRKVKIRFVSFPIIYIPIHVVELLNWCSIALISFVFLVNCVSVRYESLSAMSYK